MTVPQVFEHLGPKCHFYPFYMITTCILYGYFNHFNAICCWGYYLATSQKAGYEGDYQWVIELEKGWTTWLPSNEPFQGSTNDGPMRYTLGTLVPLGDIGRHVALPPEF